MFKLLATATLCSTGVFGKNAIPSSLLQISSDAKKSVTASDVMSQIQSQLDEFHKQMDKEVAADKEEVRNLREQQRKMERDEKAFKAKVFGNLRQPSSSFMEGGNPHFGDPYIDEAMRTFGDEIENQKRDLERVLATQRRSESALVQEKEKRPELGLISAALKSRLAMVGFDFSKLLNRIHQATIRFDQQSEAVTNKEENELRGIEAKENEVDRSVEDIRRKYHLQDPFSLLEKVRRLRFHKVVPRTEEFDSDAKILRQTEVNREKAEKHFLDVEKEIAQLPEKLMKSKERAKDQLQVPLDDDSDDQDDD